MTSDCCDILYGALKMRQPSEGGGPRVNVDTVLLAHFAWFPPRARVIEMGCAQGAISLILAKRRLLRTEGMDLKMPPLEGIDIQEELVGLADENAELNGLSGQVRFYVRDLRNVRADYEAGSFDAVIMNPPYDEQGCSRPGPSRAMAAAMHGSECSLSDVVAASRYLLKNKGKLFLVIRAKRTGELFGLLNSANVRPKRIQSVHPKPDREASVVLVEASRASGEGLSIEPPLFICGEDGKYTEKLLAAYLLENGSCR